MLMFFVLLVDKVTKINHIMHILLLFFIVITYLHLLLVQ